jgi:hypothetical protein
LFDGDALLEVGDNEWRVAWFVPSYRSLVCSKRRQQCHELSICTWSFPNQLIDASGHPKAIITALNRVAGKWLTHAKDGPRRFEDIGPPSRAPQPNAIVSLGMLTMARIDCIDISRIQAAKCRVPRSFRKPVLGASNSQLRPAVLVSKLSVITGSKGIECRQQFSHFPRSPEAVPHHRGTGTKAPGHGADGDSGYGDARKEASVPRPIGIVKAISAYDAAIQFSDISRQAFSLDRLFWPKGLAVSVNVCMDLTECLPVGFLVSSDQNAHG